MSKEPIVLVTIRAKFEISFRINVSLYLYCLILSCSLTENISHPSQWMRQSEILSLLIDLFYNFFKSSEIK